MNQCLLSALGVSNPRIDNIIRIATQHGLHGKLTGAGCGGSVFILVNPKTSDDTVQKIKKELEENDYNCWITQLGTNGVSLEQS